MSKTANLSLPLILPSQAQKHVTHNEALLALDAIVQLCVHSRNNNAIPENFEQDNQFIVGENPAGLFQGHPLELAIYQNNAWVFYKPNAGWLAWLKSENLFVVFDGQEWTDFDSTSQDTLPQLGINANADMQNRLSINSLGSLFNHDGESHRMVINKANEADTASMIWQTGFSGRAEIGLTGDDNFSLKVTPDGENWQPGLHIDATTREIETGPLSVAKQENDRQLPAFAMTGYASVGTPTDDEGVGLYLTNNIPNNRQFALLDTVNRAGMRVAVFGSLINLDGYINGARADLRLGTNTNGIAIAQSNGAVPSQLTVSNHTGTASKVCQYIGGHASQTGDYFRISSWLFNSASLQGDVLNIRAGDFRAEFGGPVKLANHTVSDAPAATSVGAGSQIYVTDGDNGSPCLAVSDGSSWRRISLGATISA